MSRSREENPGWLHASGIRTPDHCDDMGLSCAGTRHLVAALFPCAGTQNTIFLSHLLARACLCVLSVCLPRSKPLAGTSPRTCRRSSAFTACRSGLPSRNRSTCTTRRGAEAAGRAGRRGSLARREDCSLSPRRRPATGQGLTNSLHRGITQPPCLRYNSSSPGKHFFIVRYCWYLVDSRLLTFILVHTGARTRSAS